MLLFPADAKPKKPVSLYELTILILNVGWLQVLIMEDAMLGLATRWHLLTNLGTGPGPPD